MGEVCGLDCIEDVLIYTLHLLQIRQKHEILCDQT